MRKVVCNHCAKDWKIQHYCEASQFQNTAPTVIWEPEPNAFAEALEKCRAALTAEDPMKEALQATIIHDPVENRIIPPKPKLPENVN